MRKTALLIRCSEQEAKTIRNKAKFERRTISGYVLNILARTLQFEESLFSRLNGLSNLNSTLARTSICSPGPRTAILLQCSEIESKQIRVAAKPGKRPSAALYYTRSNGGGTFQATAQQLPNHSARPQI